MGKTVEILFNDCLANGRVRMSKETIGLVLKELRISEEDLNEARDGLKNSRWKWSTIQAYYSMFHSARALIYKKGYREKSHFCLKVTLEYLYAGNVSQYLVDDFQTAKIMRENADYEEHFSDIGAKKIVKSAEEFYLYAKATLK